MIKIVSKDFDDLIEIRDERPWIYWGGGECPVSADTVIKYEMRNGKVDTGLAGYLYWDESNRGCDIAKYREI